jgi:hypothetical protein
MPDISSIATIFTSLKAAKDLAEAMVDLRDAAAFQSKLLEFQSKLIDANSAAFAAQDERSTLLQRVSALEKEVARGWRPDPHIRRIMNLAGVRPRLRDLRARLRKGEWRKGASLSTHQFRARVKRPVTMLQIRCQGWPGSATQAGVGGMEIVGMAIYRRGKDLA